MPNTGKPKNPEFDAGVYRTIFEETHPNTEFVSAGSCKDVLTDAIKLKASLEIILPGLSITKLIDRDNNSEAEVLNLRKDSQVLSRYSIENYLWADDIIRTLIQTSGLPNSEAERLLAVKAAALNRPVGDAEHASDCVKDIDHLIWEELKNIPQFRGKGSAPDSFASAMLVPLITPDTATFKQPERDISD